MSSKVNIVMSTYNGEKFLREQLDSLLNQKYQNCEIFVRDDGSKDGTWNEIEKLSRDLPVVQGLRLSRNFGKESAIYAGLTYAKGSCCVVIDCDLQHPPEKIVEMYT